MPGSADDYLAEVTRKKIAQGKKGSAVPSGPGGERYQPVDQTADGSHGIYDRTAGRVTLTGMTRAERDTNLQSLNRMAAPAKAPAAAEASNRKTAAAAGPRPAAPAPTTAPASTGGASMSASMQSLREQIQHHIEEIRHLAGEAMHTADYADQQLVGLVADAIGDTHPDIVGLVMRSREAVHETAGTLTAASVALERYATGLTTN